MINNKYGYMIKYHVAIKIKIGGVKIKKRIKWTNEIFIDKLKEINPDIEPLENYVTQKTNIKFRCKKDGYEWETSPYHVLNGSGCRQCNSLNKTNSHEWFIENLKEKSPNIQVIGTYGGYAKKITVKCLICGKIWETLASSLIVGKGCPDCNKGGTLKKTHLEFVNELNAINPNIEVIGKYTGSTNKIKVKCKIDGYERYGYPTRLLGNKYECPKCAGVSKRTTDEFKKDLYKVNKNIEVLEEYKNVGEKIRVKCNIHEYEWSATSNHLLHGVGCPICSSSNAEKDIFEILKNLNISTIKEFSPEWAMAYRYDFLICDNIIIEYDGEQHYIERKTGIFSDMTLTERQERDSLKDKLASENGFRVFRIPYTKRNTLELEIKNILSLINYKRR